MRRVRLPILLFVGLAIGTLATWAAWRKLHAPIPPAVNSASASSDLALAIESARRRVLENPYSDQAWGELGKVFRAGDYRTEAAACFAQAGELDPGKPEWPYLEGDALFFTNPQRALVLWEKAADLCDRVDPDNLAPRLRLAEALLEKGLLDQAETQLRRLSERDPSAAPGKRSAGKNPSVELNWGLLAGARGDLQEGLKHLLSCQHSPFTQRRASIELAALYQNLGDLTRAREFSARARSLPPDLPWPDPFRSATAAVQTGKSALLDYVDQLERHKEYAQAVQVLQELQSRDPDLRVYVALGINLTELGRFSEAKEALQAALKSAPDNLMAQYYLAKIAYSEAEAERRQGKNQAKELDGFQTAALYARRVLAHKPDHALANMLLGLSLNRLGQSSGVPTGPSGGTEADEALEALHRAVECGPDLVEPALFLGQVLAERNRLDEARIYLERAASLSSPDDSRARQALARLR